LTVYQKELMAGKAFIPHFLHSSHPHACVSFRWVCCQLDYLGKCIPSRIRQALEELPTTLDEIYERTLQEIPDTNWEFARRLLQCVAVVSHPLRVNELAELLAFNFEAGQIPKYREDWRHEDPVHAVLSTCSTLLALVNVHHDDCFPVIQFSHFTVKEFLTSARFANKHSTISHRYNISMTPAHTLVTQACLGILLHLDQDANRDSLATFPLAEYAAEHWVEHARFEGVSQNVDEGIKQLFDRKKSHLAVWLWIYNPTLPLWKRGELANGPLSPRGKPLHYASFCGLHDVVRSLAIEHPEDVNSPSFDEGSTPLHLASKQGHLETARLLVEHGADARAQTESGETPLHWVSYRGHVELARLLVEHGADVAAQTKSGETPLHGVTYEGHVEVARLLIEHGADLGAQTKSGVTPLHQASDWGHVELARLLVEHGADVEAQTKSGETPLHQVSYGGHLEIARLLIEHGADVGAQNQHGVTPLHQVSYEGQVEVVQLLIEHGADVRARTKSGETPLHWASYEGHVELARLLRARH
jgi:ankyrin repeat protein